MLGEPVGPVVVSDAELCEFAAAYAWRGYYRSRIEREYVAFGVEVVLEERPRERVEPFDGRRALSEGGQGVDDAPGFLVDLEVAEFPNLQLISVEDRRAGHSRGGDQPLAWPWGGRKVGSRLYAAWGSRPPALTWKAFAHQWNGGPSRSIAAGFATGRVVPGQPTHEFTYNRHHCPRSWKRINIVLRYTSLSYDEVEHGLRQSNSGCRCPSLPGSDFRRVGRAGVG